MNNYSFKIGTPSDIETIIDIAEKSWKPTYAKINSLEQNEYMFNKWYSKAGLEIQMKEGQVFWLLLKDNFAIAYASYSKQSDSVFKLNKIYLIPEYKGKGLGKQFMLFIEKKVMNLNAKKLQLNVNRNNNAAAFYAACGYNIIEEQNIPFDNYWMNDYLMEKKLI